MVAFLDEQGRSVQRPKGEGDSFDTLIREHQRMIHSLCYRMTGSLADAEDLAQDTFIQAYRHFAEFRGDAQFSSWLYRIAVNLCLNWQKRQQRRQRLHQDWSAQDPRPDPGHPAHIQHVQDALLKLHPKQRAAVILTTYDGLSHAQAAKALGCSETTVSWRLFAARRKLKRILQQTLKPGAAH